MNLTSYGKMLASGVAGATALTLLHETARRKVPNAPRADALGRQAIAKVLRAAGKPVPEKGRLHWWALAGDILSNSIYYSAVARGDKRQTWQRGLFLGLSAGIGAVLLPRPLKLNQGATNRSTATQIMTVIWYLVGGLAAAATSQLLDSSE